MPDSTLTADFDSLVAYRQQLQDFCAKHYVSIMAIANANAFKVYHDVPDKPNKVDTLSEEDKAISSSVAPIGNSIASADSVPREREISLSSTATCYESLLDCPNRYIPKSHSREQTLKGLQAFIADALNPKVQWLSGESAPIYCKARTLPVVVHYLDNYDKRIEEFLREILTQLKAEPFRFAIGEADNQKPSDSYLPNGFHTYWTLSVLSEYSLRGNNGFPRLETLNLDKLDINRSWQGMLEWARQAVGYQIALHTSGSSALDSDQLAWALAILLKFDDHVQASLARQDFIRQAFKCLFEAQTNVGIWRHGAPLFHYRKSGNAYCYVFETFGVLLNACLCNNPEGKFFRQVLRPYASKLIELWKYALSTRIEQEGRYGWSSGHRINHPEAENWATASVFSFSQALRRIIGVWVREMAAERLRVREPKGLPGKVIEDLWDRGNTWPERGANVADRLTTFFINPILRNTVDSKLEPDSQLIRDDQARAAIFYGPPGASKTTLSRYVAEAIGWNFVELHASHFVAEGLPNVQRTADTIFKELMQLDRTVILFDEIDELVRAREREPDAFGRFLTTSMLPKLAELWKNRKVIYFVATNHITFFDPAITRAERFDALISVPLPSLGQKIAQLNKLLPVPLDENEINQLSETLIEEKLKGIIDYRKNEEAERLKVPGQPIHELSLPKEFALAKILLMRWDQLDELAYLINSWRTPEKPIDLTLLCDELADSALKTCEPFFEYAEGRRYDSHDFGKLMVWELLKKDGNKEWLEKKGKFRDFDALKYKVIHPGVLQEL